MTPIPMLPNDIPASAKREEKCEKCEKCDDAKREDAKRDDAKREEKRDDAKREDAKREEKREEKREDAKREDNGKEFVMRSGKRAIGPFKAAQEPSCDAEETEDKPIDHELKQRLITRRAFALAVYLGDDKLDQAFLMYGDDKSYILTHDQEGRQPVRNGQTNGRSVKVYWKGRYIQMETALRRVVEANMTPNSVCDAFDDEAQRKCLTESMPALESWWECQALASQKTGKRERVPGDLRGLVTVALAAAKPGKRKASTGADISETSDAQHAEIDDGEDDYVPGRRDGEQRGAWYDRVYEELEATEHECRRLCRRRESLRADLADAVKCIATPGH